MTIDSTVEGYASDVREAFPVVDPGAKPLGARILVQLRRTKSKTTKGGIILVEETRETEKAQNMVAKVIEIGPLAFRKRDTMEPWPEGSWAEVGDYLRVPKWGGDRWDVLIPGTEDQVQFMVLNDHEVIAKITGNPLEVRAFV
jgi:co-chaperonin GroES (HSP10)